MRERRTKEEIRAMIEKLRNLEAAAPQYLKENYSGAAEVLEWDLGELDEEDVLFFGE